MSQSKPLELDQPPAFKETKANPAATLAWIKPTLSTIYQTARTTQSTPTLARRAYLNLYSAAHDYVEVTKHSGASPSAADLYNGLEAEIRTHCSDVRKNRLLATDHDLGKELESARHILTSYRSQHSHFKKLATLVSHLLQHLERHWIKREIDERRSRRNNAPDRAGGIGSARKEVVPIRDLHLQIWKEEILQVREGESPDIAEVSARALEVLKDSEEDGTGESDKDLAKRFSEAVSSAGVETKAGEKQ